MDTDMPEQYMYPPDLPAYLFPQPTFDPFNMGFKREDMFDQ